MSDTDLKKNMSRFKINDAVQIVLRDETVVGIVAEIGEREFKVMSEDGRNLGWYPNDVSGYVTKVGETNGT